MKIQVLLSFVRGHRQWLFTFSLLYTYAYIHRCRLSRSQAEKATSTHLDCRATCSTCDAL